MLNNTSLLKRHLNTIREKIYTLNTEYMVSSLDAKPLVEAEIKYYRTKYVKYFQMIRQKELGMPYEL